MTRAAEQGRLWRASCAINAALGGDPDEPLCSRVYQQPPSLWRALYIAAIDATPGLWSGHCAETHQRFMEIRTWPASAS